MQCVRGSQLRCAALSARRIEVQGAQLEVLSTAQVPEHPPILFLHGAAHGAWCWAEHFMPYMEQQGLECHAVSFRGHVRKLSQLSLKGAIQLCTTMCIT